MPLKRHYPDIRFSGNLVTPDEIDRYEQYQVINPAISATFFGTAKAGTASQALAIGLGNTRADYPRNVSAVFSGSAGVYGVVSVTGKDQFGVAQSETLTQAAGTQTAAVVDGTKVFAQVTAATITYGTITGTGTCSLGVGTVGTTLLFGLPAKIKSVSDVKAITWSESAGIAKPINGGTIASSTYVNASAHAFRGSADLEGTMTYSVLFKPSFVAEGVAPMANL